MAHYPTFHESNYPKLNEYECKRDGYTVGATNGVTELVLTTRGTTITMSMTKESTRRLIKLLEATL